MTHIRKPSEIANEARQTILAGANQGDFQRAIESVLGAIRSNPSIADESFGRDLYNRIGGVMRSPVADEHSRRVCLEIMLHIDPFMTQMQLLGLFAQGLNGPFAIRETLRLSAEVENSEPLICRQSVIKIFQDNVNHLVVSFLSLDGDYSHQRCVRTHILNQATFMAATGTTEGREFLEDLLTCRDYALQSHVLTCLGDMEARAVQALHVIGEHRNNLERLFHQSDAIELAEIALVSMRRIAQSFSSLKPQDRLAIAPFAVIDGLRTCLTDSGLDDIAELLR